MLMVIFGAGASYDSAQAYRLPRAPGGTANFGIGLPATDPGGPWRPPLAKDLFLDPHHVLGDIVEKYGKLSHILPYLREPSDGRSLEQMLESLQEEGKTNPETQRELLSVRFYLCDLMNTVTKEWSARTNGTTNYAPLIREILRFNDGSERVCLVTFNYDLLLDRALYTFAFNPREPDGFLDSHPILKLFKLHGSADWSRLVTLPHGIRLAPQHLIEQADTIQVSDKFVRANATDPRQANNFPQPLIPAVAIPVQTKSEQSFECPLAHRTYLMEMLPEITKILIVGWQAKEAHFLGMLRSNLPRLQHVMVVGANAEDAARTLRYFMSEIRLSVPNASVGKLGFTSFVVNQEGSRFFAA
jgi:hypothetical protein